MDKSTFSPETAKQFDNVSIGNALAVESSLDCKCRAYQDVFTYQRWKAQGFQVQKGQKGIKLRVFRTFITKATDDKPEKITKRPWWSTVFCRCQVK